MFIQDPYTVPYKAIYAICDKENKLVEIIEHSNCYGGSAWARFHFSKSPLVISSGASGNIIRYLVKTGKSELHLSSSVSAAGIESVIVEGEKVEITYAGLGGGGIGATTCRARAEDVLSYNISEAGGKKLGRGTIVVPRRERLLIGVDDTDSREEGATWSLMHNIAHVLDSEKARYISHSLVQLYPVAAKTQNCVSTVLEFACLKNQERALLEEVRSALEEYSVSRETGMVALSSFDAEDLVEYSRLCRTLEIQRDLALETARKLGVEIWMDGNGVIGALAALPWFGRQDESVVGDWSENRD